MIKVKNTSPDCSLPFAPAKPELWKVDLRPRLIKTLPACHNSEPAAIPHSSMTWSTYFKHWGIQQSQKESGALDFWGVIQNLYCTRRVQGDRVSGKGKYVFPCVPSEELLRASQLEHQGCIWTGTCLLSWSSQKLADMAQKHFLNITWNFSQVLHEIFSTWPSTLLKDRWCRAMQGSTVWGCRLTKIWPRCTSVSLGRVCAAVMLSFHETRVLKQFVRRH